jgi:carbon starvation protein CstA
VPFDLLARADAGIRSAGQFATLAGALIGGVMGTAWGTRSVLWVTVGTALCASVLAARRLAVRTGGRTLTPSLSRERGE